MPDDQKFVIAYSTQSGNEVRIPAHYFDSPVLSKRFRKTPKPVDTTRSTPPKSATAPVAAPTKKEK